MIPIPQNIIDLFHDGSVKKQIVISFPNGEREAITNDSLVAESLTFTESVCSSDSLSFGLTESNVLEFETLNVENIKGCEVDVTINVFNPDIETHIIDGKRYIVKTLEFDTNPRQPIHIDLKGSTQLEYDFYDVYGFDTINAPDIVYTRQDGTQIGIMYSEQYRGVHRDVYTVPFTIQDIFYEPYNAGADVYFSYVTHSGCIRYVSTQVVDSDYYPVHLGKFKIDSCDRQAGDLSRRSVTAYSLDKGFNLSSIERAKEKALTSTNTKYKFDVCKWVLSNIEKVDISQFSISKSTWSGNSIDDDVWYFPFTDANARIYLKSNGKRVIFNTKDSMQNLIYVDAQAIDVAEIQNTIDVYLEEYATANGLVVDKTKDSYKKLMSDLIARSYPLFKFSDYSSNGYNTSTKAYSGCNNPLIYPNISLSDTALSQQVGRPEIYAPSTYTLHNGDNTYSETITIRPDAELYIVDTSAYPQIEYSVKRTKTKNDSGSTAYYLKKDLSEVVGDITVGYIELMGKFGKYSRDGVMRFVGLDSMAIKTYSMSEFKASSLWYDEKPTKKYGRVECDFTDSDEDSNYACYDLIDDYNDSFYNCYNISNNYLISNCTFTESQINSILESFANNVKDIQYMPFNMDAVGLPYIEAGDTIDIDTGDEVIKTILLRRTMKGIQSLTDTLEANGSNDTSTSQGSYSGGTSGGSSGMQSVVTSVNGQAGTVELTASDVGALPDTTPIPSEVTEATVSGWGFTKNTGTYSKPSGGIPKSDLNSSVQASLNKADSSVQSVSVTQTLTSGTEIGSVTVDGRQTILYAPIGSSSGEMALELLWENPAPASNFAEQTINLDLSKYSAIVIKAKASKSSDNASSQVVIKDGVKEMIRLNTTATGGTKYIFTRYVTVSDSGVVFEAGARGTMSSTSSTSADNQYTIPLQIYGVANYSGAEIEALRVDVTTLQSYFDNGKAKKSIESDRASADVNGNSIISYYATKEEIEKANRQLDALWKLNKGQTYDFLTQTNTSHIDDIPSGAYYGTIDVLGGMTKKCSNLWDEQWENGYYSPTTGNAESSTSHIRSKNYIEVVGGTNYYITNSSGHIMFYDSTKSYISYVEGVNSFTTPSNAKYIRFSRYGSYGSTYKNDIAIIKGTSGTYEPYYEGIRSNPISEVKSVGANVWDEEWELGAISSSDGSNVTSTTQIRSKNYIPLQSGKTYTIVSNVSGSGARFMLYKADKTFIDWYTFENGRNIVASGEIAYMRFYVSGTSYTSGIAIIRGTSGQYSSYKEDTYTIPSSSMTELISMGYGMGINDSCYNYLEFTEDKVLYHKRIAEIDLGSLTWTYKSERSGFYANMPATSIFADLSSDGICTEYEVVKDNASLSTLIDKQLAYGRAFYENRSQIFIKESGYTDATTFKSAMNGVKLYYELASEQITDVTDLVSTDNTLDTESNGTMFYNGVNDIPTPHTMTYIIKLDEV